MVLCSYNTLEIESQTPSNLSVKVIMSWNEVLQTIQNIKNSFVVTSSNLDSQPLYVANKQKCLEMIHGVSVLGESILRLRNKYTDEEKMSDATIKCTKKLQQALNETYRLIRKNIMPRDLIWLKQEIWIAEQVVNIYKVTQGFNEIKRIIGIEAQKLVDSSEFRVIFPIFNTSNVMESQTSDYVELKKYLSNRYEIDKDAKINEMLVAVQDFLEPLSERQAMEMFLESRNRIDTNSKLQQLYERLKNNKQYQDAYRIQALQILIDQHKGQDAQSQKIYTETPNWSIHLETYSPTIMQQMYPVVSNFDNWSTELGHLIDQISKDNVDDPTRALLEFIRRIYVPVAPLEYQTNFLAPERIWKYRFPVFSVDDKDITLGSAIGRGAGGVVYKGYIRAGIRDNDVPIAIKELIPPDRSRLKKSVIDNNAAPSLDSFSIHISESLENEQHFVQSVERALHHEARVAWSLSGHPNCVKLYGVCLDPHALILEYCNSGKLQTWLYKIRYGKTIHDNTYIKSEKLTLQQKISCVGQLIQGLHFLHSKGFTHRDIKSSNCLVHNHGTPQMPVLSFKLTDFGSVKSIVNFVHSNPFSSSSSQIRTRTSGTPGWMAPERYEVLNMTLSDRKIVENDPAVDIYSMGCLIGEILLEQPPFMNFESQNDIRNAFLGRNPPYPHDMTSVSNISDQLANLIRRCCEPNPKKRCTIIDIMYQLWPPIHKELTSSPLSTSSLTPESLDLETHTDEPVASVPISAKSIGNRPFIKMRIVSNKDTSRQKHIEVIMELASNIECTLAPINEIRDKLGAKLHSMSKLSSTTTDDTITIGKFEAHMELVDQTPQKPIISIPMLIYSPLKEHPFFSRWIVGRDYFLFFKQVWHGRDSLDLTLLPEYQHAFSSAERVDSNISVGDSRSEELESNITLTDPSSLSTLLPTVRDTLDDSDVKQTHIVHTIRPRLRTDKEIVLAAVQQDGHALQSASPTLKNDKEIVMAAVQQNGEALQYASPTLKNDKEMVLAAVKQDGVAFQYASPELQNDKKFVLAAVQQGGDALQSASPELKNDKEIVLAAVQEHGQALHYASPTLKNDKKIVMAAVQQNGYALKYASPTLKNDKEMVLAAVKHAGEALQYASPELKNDKDIVLAAIQRNKHA